jgi:hypothetical protein
MIRSLLISAILLLSTTPAHAYIGPGVGLGAIALTIALILGILLLLVGFLWYPLKRLLRRGKNVRKVTAPRDDADC